MKNKSLIIGVIIFLAAVVFRFLCLDKAGGLWYDEVVSYKEAAAGSLLAAISYTLKTDVHLPLYPALLHLWAKMFSFSDISLRAFSAFFGVLTVAAAYFAGKELKSKETGMWCAGVFAVNSFLIYYSQEVRLYSLLMFLITLLTFTAAKVINQREDNLPSILAGIAFGVVSWLTVHTYTIAFLYVIPVIAILYFIKFKMNEDLKPLNYGTSVFGVFCLPALFYLASNYTNYTNQINGYYCDWSSLFVIFQDWFSPIQEGLLNNPVHYMEFLFTHLNFVSVVFIFLPVLISFGVVVYALKKDKQAFWLLVPSIIFLLAEIIAFKTTNFKILARYASPALPNVLLVLGLGLSILPKVKKINIIIPLLLFAINASYLIFADHASYKLPREGFRPVAELINEQSVSDGDYIIVWNRKEVLDKYVKTEKLNILSLLKDFAYRSESILGHEAELNKLSLNERKRVLRPYFSEVKPPENNISLMTYILTNMKKGQKFIITSNKYFDEFSPAIFAEIVNNDEKYNHISYNDLLTIKSLITIKEMCAYNLKFIGRFEKDGNVIFVFEKG